MTPDTAAVRTWSARRVAPHSMITCLDAPAVRGPKDQWPRFAGEGGRPDDEQGGGAGWAEMLCAGANTAACRGRTAAV